MRIMFLSVTPEDPAHKESNARVEELLNSYASPGTSVELAWPDDHPGSRVGVTMGAQSVRTGLHHAMQTSALVRKIVWAEETGYDAVIQSNTFDPGVEAGRLAVRIPVVGLLRTSLHVATTLADRIGITVPLEGHLPYTRRILRSYGMQDFVTDIRVIGMYGEGLAARKGELLEHTVGVMRSLVEDTGAECLIPLGGALFPYIVSPADLEQQVGVPVLNTKSIGIRFTEMCVQFGMTHSHRTYPSQRLSYDNFTELAYSSNAGG
jgi:Asp/Glu/hydantoin racemase